jgi:hypothetical protein
MLPPFSEKASGIHLLLLGASGINFSKNVVVLFLCFVMTVSCFGDFEY